MMKKLFEKLSSIFRYFNPRRIFLILGFSLIFFITLRPPTDPDMGWHLRDGKYLVENNFQVAKTDIFSWTMPDFPVVMHEWMTDWLMYIISERAGLFVLALISALITSIAFILVSLGMKNELECKIIAGIMGLIASIPILGVRPQMLSLLGLASVIFVIYEFKANPKTKKIFFLPLIFFIWVNFHGGFPVGLFLLALFILFELFKFFIRWRLRRKREARFSLWLVRYLEEGKIKGYSLFQLAIVSFVSFLLTFVNPYGWRIYVEVFTTVFDTYAKNNIGEWLPVSMVSPISYQFIIYLALFAILLFFGFRKIGHIYLIIALIFLYLAFSSWRHVPIFLIISIPLWVEIVNKLSGQELSRLTRNRWFLLVMAVVVFFVAKQQIQIVYPISASVDRLAKEGGYPIGAVKYLRENPIEGRMLNEYNWGGFLIWQYPEKKVYIDGRMPSWKLGEYKVFEEFNQIMRFDEGWQDALDRHEIGFVLVYDNFVHRMIFSNIGWEEKYADGLAAIYVRPQ
jgi:hypothetical protein